jgi:hypothetical protein
MSSAPPPLPASGNPDNDHLRLLAIFHYVVAGILLLGLGFIGIHYTIMRTVFGNPGMWKNQPDAPVPPAEFFNAFVWFYAFFGVCTLLGCFANLLSAGFIRKRRHRTFSLVVAGFDCTIFPFGTALGVFTFIVLLRDSVRRLYGDDTGDR